MRQFPAIFVYGFAIFAMFFGSGNLVFPLQIGFAAGDHWLMGFTGLLLTGILLPFTGLFVIKIYRGDYLKFFGEAGTLAQRFLPLFMLSLMGPFGVIPRCITVAWGSLADLSIAPSLPVFSLVFGALMYILCRNDRLMIQILGKWLSPLLMISLALLIGAVLVKAPASLDPVAGSQAFGQGFLSGYQTMDLFAAFFFAALVFAQIQQRMPDASHREQLLFAIKPAILGAALLALVYMGFVFSGAHYAPLLRNTPPEQMLSRIATQALGSKASILLGLALCLSCLTTAVALNKLFSTWLADNLRLQPKYFPRLLLATCALSCAMSLLNFTGIAAFLAPVLEITYPGLISLTLLTLLFARSHILKKLVFYGITVTMTGWFVMEKFLS